MLDSKQKINDIIKNGKVLLVFPPQWNPANPYLALPLLSGQINNAGFNATSWDINVEFFNEILTSSYILNSLENSQNFIKNFENGILEKSSKNQEKYNYIKTYINLRIKRIRKIIDYIESAVLCLKSENFYKPHLFLKAIKIIEYALEIISLPFYPSQITLNSFYNPNFSFSVDDVIAQCNDEDINPFIKFYKEKIKNIDNDVYCIAISIAAESQIVPALTLSRIIKKYTNITTILGGNLTTRIDDTFIKHKHLFDEYFDYVLTGDGENAIIDFIKEFPNKNNLSNISGLIYKKDNNIIKNSKVPYSNINECAPLNFNGIDFKKYFTPDIVLLYQLSKGCYWGKCKFCDFSYYKDYCCADTKKVVNEIKQLKELYNIKFYRFSDDAVKPQYYDKLSDEIEKNNLNINFYSFARLETAFNEKLLNKMYKAGLRMLQWGVESGSDRILNLMQKGTSLKSIPQILRNASNAKIWNYIFLIIGFPTETKSEALKTVNFLHLNKNFIDSYSVESFYLQKHAEINKYLKELKIKNIKDDNELCPHYDYDSEGMTKEEIRKIINDLLISSSEISIKKKSFSTFLFSDYLFLYICKYGYDWLKEYSVSMEDFK